MLRRSIFAIALAVLTAGGNVHGSGLFDRIPLISGGDSCGSEDSCSETGCGTDYAPGCDMPGSTGCGESCGEGCGSVCGDLFGCGGGLADLTSLIKKSDHCFDDFISPMTNPVFFEDPRTLTEARMIFANHSLPGAGGSAQLYAMQVRAAVTENLSIIATKDGFLVSDSPVLRDGWADISAGLKLNIYRNVQTRTLLSVGTTYEAPFGTPRALQGNGDGEFHIFGSGGTVLFEDYHYLSGLGLRLPVDRSAESTSMYWSNHLDRRIGNSGFYLLGECNWYHWLSSGSAVPASFEGVDLINLGSNNVAGNDIVTAAIGVKYKPNGNTEIGVAWEAPLTDRRDIFDDRLTVDWILRY